MAGNAMTGYRKFTRGTAGAVVFASVLGTMALGGCVSYTNVPVPESAPAFESANHGQSIRVTRRALQEVVDRYPAAGPNGRYAINLPSGTNEESAMKILDGLPAGAILPYEGMSDEVPVYHIGRIWIRASDAKVDVLYPITDYQGGRREGNVTVWLNGGLQNWRVARVQHWAPGTIETPPIYVPLPEETLELMKEQAKAEKKAQKAGMEEESAPAEPAPVAEPATEDKSEGSGASEELYRQVPTGGD